MPERESFLPKIVQAAINKTLKWFFHHLYHSMAWSYDLVAAIVSIGQWRQWVLETANFIQGPHVLELGFGTGHLQEHLARSGLENCGLDESRQMANRVSRRLRKQNHPRKIVRGLAQALPFAGNYFDCLVATFPAPYIADPETVSEIRRVLKPGGKLVILMASWHTGGSAVAKLMGLLFRVTGQVPYDQQAVDNFLAPYEEAGFQTELSFAHLPKSRLLFIIAWNRQDFSSSSA